MILRGTYFYPLLVDPLFNWLERTREIGALSFNFKQIILFFAIILVSAFISKVVALLSSENWLSATHTSKSGIGSRLILVRISITTIGIIIAIVSIGIPFDRVAIIISALGVGIGFGLQALINNLVSGIIIAVEKTVNVNDIVEIDGITGKMKSIGMRRSIVSTYDGSDVIIPNGDLMSKHLINWTMGNNRRRFEIVVGVAYDSDLEKVKTLIEKALTSNNNVLKNPKPDIWITNFNSSSIDFSIKFWVNHFNIGFNVKSELMLEINKVFKANDIVIPFPQQDVYIKSEDLNPGKIDGD